MAQEAFHYPLGTIPNMSCEELLDHVRMMDPRVWSDLIIDNTPDELEKRQTFLDYLQDREPVLFEALENIVRAYQTAYHVAVEQRQIIVRSYHRFRICRNTLEDDGRKLEKEIDKQIATAKPAKERKRQRQPENDEIDKLELEQIKDIQNATKAGTEYFLTQEKFTDDFPVHHYRHFVKKGMQKWQLAELSKHGKWTTLYHVNGPWQAEKLVEKLDNENQNAIIVKRFRGGGDQEVMSYKVISGPK